MQHEDIEVSVSDTPADDGGRDAVVLDRVRGRAWSGHGKTASEATTEAVRRFLGDRRVREYVG